MDIKIVENWNSYLDAFSDVQKDIYYTEEYVKLYEDDKNKALCIVCSEQEKILLLPYLRGQIDAFYDFETAYGYGGPIANTEDELWIGNALEALKIYMKENHYLCGFIRFHPLLKNEKKCINHMEVLYDRKTISIDTSVAVEEIWNSQIKSKNRNMIRKAEKNGLLYKADFAFQYLDEFIGLYHETMKRLGAEDFYYFDRNYYHNFIRYFEHQAFLGTVWKDENLTCGAIFMYSKEYGHYHLEGSDRNYAGLGANNYLLWKTAEMFHELGIKQFHLGGGSDSTEDNSLLKFKSSFSHIENGFYIGKLIFDSDHYGEIAEEWKKRNSEKAKQYGNRLLCYRY